MPKLPYSQWPEWKKERNRARARTYHERCRAQAAASNKPQNSKPQNPKPKVRPRREVVPSKLTLRRRRTEFQNMLVGLSDDMCKMADSPKLLESLTDNYVDEIVRCLSRARDMFASAIKVSKANKRAA
jgi:hypothetical protein